MIRQRSLPRDDEINVSSANTHATGPAQPRNGYLLGALAMLAAIAAMTALWSAINLHNSRLNGWMALPTALDAVLLLRLAGTRRGLVSQLLTSTATILTAGIAVWITAGTRIGRVMGMSPADSLGRMDPMLALEVAREAGSSWDWLSLLLALALCLWLQRDRQPEC